MFNKGNVILNMKNLHGSRLSRTYIHMAHTYIYLILLYARSINISHDLSDPNAISYFQNTRLPNTIGILI